MFPLRAPTLLVGRQEGHPASKKAGCWFVGDDNCSYMTCKAPEHCALYRVAR